jgi:hypothetical protein
MQLLSRLSTGVLCSFGPGSQMARLVVVEPTRTLFLVLEPLSCACLDAGVFKKWGLDREFGANGHGHTRITAKRERVNAAMFK